MSFRHAWAALAAGLALVMGAAAAAAPLEAYGRLPAIDLVSLSPDGSKVAYVIPIDGKHTVAVQSVDGAGYQGGLTGTDQKVRALIWADPERLLVVKSVTGYAADVVSSRGEWNMVQSFDVTRNEATPFFELNRRMIRSGSVEIGMNVIISLPEPRRAGGKTTVYVRGVSFVDGVGAPALYAIDPRTGRDTLVERATGRGHERSWILGADGALLGRVTYDQLAQRWSLGLRRDGAWVEAYSVEAPLDAPAYAGLSPDGSALMILTQEDGRDHYRPLSLKDGSLGPPDPMFKDIFRPIADPVTQRIVGGVKLGAAAEEVFFSPADQAAWKRLLDLFPGEEVEFVSWSDDRRKMVVQVAGPEHGVVYVLVDLDTRKMTSIGQAYPGIGPDDVATVVTIAYPAADGRRIDAYLTLPSGRELKGLPLVVLPHGGPVGRDTPGFDWWAQALASRGYAVLQPQFRGSSGFGWDLYAAGFGQWGRKMQTDLSDGVRGLAAKGYIDPKRVCIVGASYGGYAALAGVTLESGVYRCAVAVAGLSDLRKLVNWSVEPSRSVSVRHFTRLLGVEKPDAPALDAISPVRQAARAGAPVLLIHGKDDTVVRLEQSRWMADALKDAGKPVELLVLPGEDHWLSRSDTRQRVLEATVKFLEVHNPAR